jgi:hypothetical protein
MSIIGATASAGIAAGSLASVQWFTAFNPDYENRRKIRFPTVLLCCGTKIRSIYNQTHLTEICTSI